MEAHADRNYNNQDQTVSPSTNHQTSPDGQSMHQVAESSRSAFKVRGDEEYGSSMRETQRPRTTTVSSESSDVIVPVPQNARTFSSGDYMDALASPCASNPTTPTGLTEVPAFNCRKRPRRPAVLDLEQDKGYEAEVAGPMTSTQAVATAPNTKRLRSSSVPLEVNLSPDANKKPTRQKMYANEPATELSMVKPSLPPLSHHQLLALHRLRLPRPSFVTDSLDTLPAWNTARRAPARQQQSLFFGTPELHIPALTPPITRQTLRELDLSDILNNPQLRHDVVFDENLVFRPNFDGERGKRKLLTGDRYWKAVVCEISTGCRCTAFKHKSQEPMPCVCGGLGISSSAVSRLVSRASVNSTSVLGHNVPLAARLPSRIGPLVDELRHVLLSLLPSPMEGSGKGAYQDISAVLDSELISQQVMHGVFDVRSLGQFLEQTMKTHCAPMRDGMVNAMVACMQSGPESIAKGLRLAFEILELMKLDIVNHQLRTLRPYLLDTALDFELRSCVAFAERHNTAGFKQTSEWIFAASFRSSSVDPVTVVRDGLLELVFHLEGRNPSVTHYRNSSRSKRSEYMLTTALVPETLQLDSCRLQSFHSDVTDLTMVYMLLMLFRQVVAPKQVTDAQLNLIKMEIWILLHAQGLVRSPGGITAPTSIQDSVLPPTLATAGWRKLQDEGLHTALRPVLLSLASRAKSVCLGHSVDGTTVDVPDPDTVALMTSWVATHFNHKDNLFLLFQNRLKSAMGRLLEDQMASSRGWWLKQSSYYEQSMYAGRSSSSSVDYSACSKSARRLDVGFFDAGKLSGVATSSLSRPLASASASNNKRKRQEDEQRAVKKARLEDGPDDFAVVMKRHGLEALAGECHTLAERIGRVAAFHYDIYKKWYDQVLSHQQANL